MVTRLSDFLNTSFSTFSANDTNNTGVTYPGAVVHTTTLTPGVGIGAGLDFQVETTNNNNETGMRLEAVTTDVTAGSEDFDFVVKLMQNGAAANEKMRLNSNGSLSIGTASAFYEGVNVKTFTLNGANSSILTLAYGDSPRLVFQTSAQSPSVAMSSGLPILINSSGATSYIDHFVNGASRLYIANTGNVGISNTSPAHKLRVDGDISLSGGVHANASLGTSGHILTTNGTGSYWAAANVSNVTGTLAIGNGGTNSTATPTQYGVAYGTGTAYAFTAQSSIGQFLYGIGNLGAPVWITLDFDYMPDAWIKKTVRVATTTNITLSNLQTVDGISLAASDRVLVKNQSNAVQNGIYSVVNGGNWARQDGTFNMPGAMVTVAAGTVNGGRTYRTDFKASDTVGVTAMNWYRVLDESTPSGTSRSSAIAMSILFG